MRLSHVCHCSPQALLQPAPDNTPHLSTAHGRLSSASGSVVLSSEGTSLDGTSQSGHNNNHSAAGAVSSSLAVLSLTASTFGAHDPHSSVAGDRPPSPRTLLAYQSTMPLLLQNTHAQNYPAGISTPRGRATAAQSTTPTAAAQQGRPVHQPDRYFLAKQGPGSCDSSEDDTDGDPGADSEVEDSNDEGGSSAAHERQHGSTTPSSSTVQGKASSSVQGQHVAAPALQLPADGPYAADGSGHATPSSARRASLARWVTLRLCCCCRSLSMRFASCSALQSFCHLYLVLMLLLPLFEQHACVGVT